ncbi:MAG: sugar-binding domain-containing protein, partial [Mangrovibacterium sp.]
MKTNPTYHTILFLLALFSFSCSRNTPAGRERIRLTNDWKFILADRAEFSEPAYKDSAWRTLQLPHDWSIEGEFSETHPASAGGGALPGGTGWYRKHFRVDSADVNRQIHIDFDGIYRHSDVWINGHHLGHRPNGYISFRYNLTPYLRYEENNVLAVRVDNSRQPNSRWYSGSGIYRNVWLVKTNKVHVAHWGTFVTTPEVSREKAIIRIETLLHNNDRLPRRVYLRTVLLDAKGATLISADDSVAIPAGGQQMCKQHMQVMNPALWSVDNPYLYRIKTLVNEKGKNIDTYTTDLGIRCFEFDAEKGFFLNGQPTKILGVCLHHDLGCLGTAVNNRALERRLELLKAMGCNAIRTTHNPPAPELLALCDRMGFIVQDEAFDMWRKKKSSYDYALDFPQWHERDLTDQIRRDRNHPSVVMWSIGNEVLEQWNDVHADTLSLQEASLLLNFEKQESAGLEQKEEMNVNALLTSKLAGIVRELDPTRPVTTGNNEVNPSNNLFRSDAM